MDCHVQGLESLRRMNNNTQLTTEIFKLGLADRMITSWIDSVFWLLCVRMLEPWNGNGPTLAYEL